IFQGIPEGCDAYLLCRILLNWGHEQALAILRSCRRGMGAHSKLLIIDFLTTGPEHPAHMDSVINDLNLFVIWGGGSRTEKAWRELVAEAGLVFEGVRCAEPPSTLCVIEARPG
ncbi:MAG: methyltransferase, partial [Pseudomonadota bacterium]